MLYNFHVQSVNTEYKGQNIAYTKQKRWEGYHSPYHHPFPPNNPLLPTPPPQQPTPPHPNIMYVGKKDKT